MHDTLQDWLREQDEIEAEGQVYAEQYPVLGLDLESDDYDNAVAPYFGHPAVTEGT